MPEIPERHHYRPDIDGLRAIAVTIVVLFHAGIPGFAGGFVGVDVFFVISGFLIVGILSRSFSSRSFSLVEFYERRARRILPALIAVVFLVMAITPFIIKPWDIAAFGRSVKYVALSVANVDFKNTLEGYGGADADLTLMLHMWSLSVEEQFYLFVPLMWMLLCRFTQDIRYWRCLFIIIALMSFGVALWMIGRDQSACFFLLPYRAWELAIGGGLALTPIRSLGPRICGFLGTCGLIMIAAATVFFGENTLFPGAWALLPCCGAALVIIAGYSGGSFFHHIVLRARPVVMVGLISYSVYLVHWPALVFVRYREQYSGSVTPWWGMLAVVMSVYALGWLSWRFVETPFRKSGNWSRRQIFVLSGLGIASMYGLGYFYQKTSIFTRLLPPEARAMAEARFSINPLLKKREINLYPNEGQHYGDMEIAPDTVLWGDSHARVLAFPLHELALANKKSFILYQRRGTPPVRGVRIGTGYNSRSDTEFTERVYESIIQNQSITKVILCARWAAYTEGYTGAYGPAERAKRARRILVDFAGSSAAPGSPEVRSVFHHALSETINGLVEAGKIVYLVYPVPELGYTLPQVLANESIEGRDPAEFSISAARIYFERMKPTLAMLDQLSERKEVVQIRPETLMIESGNIRTLHDGKPLYYDDNHLSVEGGRFVMPLFRELF